MAPDTQTIDFDTTRNAQDLALAVPFGSYVSWPESERAVGETLSAAIKRADLDDDDDEDEDDFDEEGEEEDEFEDEDEDEDEDEEEDEDDDEDDDEDEDEDLDDEDEEDDDDDDVKPLSVKWRRAR
jgi:hypothetical protein